MCGRLFTTLRNPKRNYEKKAINKTLLKTNERAMKINADTLKTHRNAARVIAARLGFTKLKRGTVRKLSVSLPNAFRPSITVLGDLHETYKRPPYDF